MLSAQQERAILIQYLDFDYSQSEIVRDFTENGIEVSIADIEQVLNDRTNWFELRN